MKNLIYLMTALLMYTGANAADLPFEFKYDIEGKLTDVVIADNYAAKSSTDTDADVFITELKRGLNTLSVMSEDALPGLESLDKDERLAFLDAKIAANRAELTALLERPDVLREFKKIVDLLRGDDFFNLIATTQGPNQFDKENLIVEGIEKAMDIAEKVLGLAAAYNVFEFLVEEYFDALINRREFMQNALITYLDMHQKSITDAEKSKILSSIFYSRISIYNIPKKNKAKKKWDTYGDKELKKLTKKCKADSDAFFNSCFKHDGEKVYNLVDRKHRLSKKPSVAFNFDRPSSVAITRYGVMAAKLVLKLATMPGFLKLPIKKWLESIYKDQRATEGLLYGSLILKGEDGYALWVRHNTINPAL